MNVTKKKKKLVHVGNMIAEVDVELIYSDEAWSPYLSLEDVYKLEEVRQAMQKGDISLASQFARIYNLVPVAA